MRHQVDGRKLGRNTSHRIALFRNLANQLIQHEQIVTTVPKAKELRRVVERLITLGKTGGLHAKRIAYQRLGVHKNVVKLFNILAERYAKRPGGYTRVLKIDGTRWGDAAETAMIELVDHPLIDRRKKIKKSAKTDKTEGHEQEQDHSEHKHGHSHAHEKHGGGRGKISGANLNVKATKTSNVRKTPTQSGGSSGGRSGGSSS